jgi:hypothetical protein
VSKYLNKLAVSGIEKNVFFFFGKEILTVVEFYNFLKADLLNIAATAADFLMPLFYYEFVCHRNRLCHVIASVTTIYQDEI